MICYEQPLNERVRTLLRLEHLFTQADAHWQSDSPWDSQTALLAILDILALCGRSDLKQEILKELERQRGVLAVMSHNPRVDHSRLGALLERLAGLENRLHAVEGPLGQALRDHDFLTAVRQRMAIPGGACDFDLPQFHYWLHRPAPQRSGELHTWLGAFDLLRQVVDVLLGLIRDSAQARAEVAEAGFYQRALDIQTPFQLVRVQLPEDASCFPEISAGRHRFSVRFLTLGTEGRNHPCGSDVQFLLSCCAL